MKARDTVPASFLLPEWLRAPLVRIGPAKEVREILPYALVSALTSLLWLLGPAADADGLNAAWVVGELATVAMGAAMFGHEFTHRTVSLLLVQPVTRAEIWWRKMQVLGVAMGVVVVCRTTGAVLHGSPAFLFTFAGLMSLSGVGYGLLVAPLMAILSRGTLAGAVFTVALPAISWQVSGLVAFAVVWSGGQNPATASELAPAVFLTLVAAQWVSAPLLARRAFLRLEATDTRRLAIRLPRWLGRTVAKAPSRNGWLPKLVGKELRLLAPAVLVAGLYLAICLAEIILERVGGARTDVTSLASFIYAGLISLLIGALACAEERQAGTLLWQLVQPVAAGRQWVIKAGVAILAALVLALGVPWLVWLIQFSLMPPESVVGAWGFGGTPVAPMDYLTGACQVTALCAIGLYASSASPNALRAMLWSVPVGLVFVTLFNGVLHNPGYYYAFFPLETADRSFLSPAGVLAIGFWLTVLVGVLAVVLGCAFRNFRSLDQRAGRVFVHLLVVAVALNGAALAGLGFAGFMRAAGMTLPERVPTVDAAECDANLTAIDTALTAWSAQHANTLPASLREIAPALVAPQALFCPAEAMGRPATDEPFWNAGDAGYRYRLTGDDASSLSAEVTCPLHGGTRVVLAVAPARQGVMVTPEESTRQSRVRLMLRYGTAPQATRSLSATDAPADAAPAPKTTDD